MNAVMRLFHVFIFLSLAACAPSMQMAEKGGQPVAGSGVQAARLAAQPRSYESHYQRALQLLYKPGRNDADLHMARVGFETAARLSRDYWPAWFYAGIVHDVLGNNEQATGSFVRAATIEDNAALWNAAAVSALRGGYEHLALGLHRRALSARIAAQDEVSDYVSALYTSYGASRPVTHVPAAARDDEASEIFTCRSAIQSDDGDDDEDDDDDDDGGSQKSGGLILNFGDEEEEVASENTKKETSTTDLNCDQQNIIVDAYIIRRNGENASTAGIDLLSALQIQFGGQFLDYTYSNPSGGPSTHNVSSSASVTIPDVTYALSIASDRQSLITIDATPSIVARLGQKSEIFEGTEVYIIANGDSSSGEFEKEIGVKLKIEPTILTESAVTLRAGVEFSLLDTNGDSSTNFQTLNTDKLIFDVSGTFPFGAAVLIGKLTSSVVKESGEGQTGLRSIPGLRHLFGIEDASAKNREVLVLATVRHPSAVTAALEHKKTEVYERLGIDVPKGEITRYGYIHAAPPLTGLISALGLDPTPES